MYDVALFFRNAIHVPLRTIAYGHLVGASPDRQKFGNRILRWYQANGLDVTPIHPKESMIEGLNALNSIHQVTVPQQTSISIVTPPKVTLQVLQDAKQLGFKYIWIQPGAEDNAVKGYVAQNSDLKSFLVDLVFW
ncbi:unnamed protein product [Rhizopus microsporus]